MLLARWRWPLIAFGGWTEEFVQCRFWYQQALSHFEGPKFLLIAKLPDFPLTQPQHFANFPNRKGELLNHGVPPSSYGNFDRTAGFVDQSRTGPTTHFCVMIRDDNGGRVSRFTDSPVPWSTDTKNRCQLSTCLRGTGRGGCFRHRWPGWANRIAGSPGDTAARLICELSERLLNDEYFDVKDDVFGYADRVARPERSPAPPAGGTVATGFVWVTPLVSTQYS